jgi:NADH-quinone oxidoreductase subunit F
VPKRDLLLEHADERDLTQLDEYRAVGGYAALEKARALEPDVLIEDLVTSTLRGRGGAGFPTGRKASLVDRSGAKPSYLVVNADESEPGAFKDREIMRRVPHRLLEGCLIAARAILSRHVFIYIRGEYVAEYEVLQRAVDDARAAGLFDDVDVIVHRGAGAYICGEETALLDSLEGKRGQPRPRPPFPPIQGLYMSPTQINNVQTIATIPAIIELGAAEFLKIGPQNSPGTAIFSLSGNVVHPGNYELELGSTLRELIYDIGGGVPDGRALKAIIPGGSSVPVLTPDQLDTPMDYDSIAAAGSFFGSAAVMVIDERCCMVQLALRAEKFYMHESCGKCTPCREGTRWLVQILEKIEDGRAEYADLDLLENVGERILGRSLCALGDFAVYPVQSYLRKFRAEFEAHVEQARCPFGGESSVEGILAPSDQHAHHPTATVPS